MAGIFRNFIAIIQALLSQGVFTSRSTTLSSYWVTPFDAGTHVLKSDKYLQLAEAAQLDFLIKTKLLRTLLRRRIAFVNASQLIKFSKPINLFARVRVDTSIIYWDERCAYFSHTFLVGNSRKGEVLVKMKFKRGAVTVPPAEVIGPSTIAKPAAIEKWNEMLATMR